MASVVEADVSAENGESLESIVQVCRYVILSHVHMELLYVRTYASK